MVNIKTDVSAWKNIVERAAEVAVSGLSEQMMNDSIDYIPTDGENMLRNAGKIEKTGEGERALTWDNVYAGYQWFGARADGTHEVKHYTTPGTGKAWVDEAKAANKATWDKVAQNGFTEGMK